MPVNLNEQEARREHLSGGTGGGAIKIDLDYTTASDVNVLHHVTAGYVDSVWIQVHNGSSHNVTFNLVLNPSDDTSTSAIDEVTTAVIVPQHDSLWVLQGDSFRLRGSNTSTITGYVAAGDVDRLRVTGYVVRAKGELLY